MNILAIGAHPDDIELGCGGTLVRHASRGDVVTMLVLTAGQNGPASHDRIHEQEEAATVLGADLVWGTFHDCSVSNNEEAVVRVIEGVVRDRHIDMVYTHFEGDSHQDHRATALLTLGAARNVKRVLQYNSPSARHFSPRIFIDISDTVDKKLAALAEHRSQVLGSGRVDLPAVRAQAVMFGAPLQLDAAEGFVSERMLLDI